MESKIPAWLEHKYLLAVNKEYNQVMSKLKNKSHDHLSERSIRNKMRRIDRLKGNKLKIAYKKG